MATEYDELHEHFIKFEEYSSDAGIQVKDRIGATEDFLDSKAGISLINDDIVAQGVLLENIKVENLDEQLSKDIVSTENCEKYNNDADIKLEDFTVQTGDFLDSKAGISLTSYDNLAQGDLENIKVENLIVQSDKNFKCNLKLTDKIVVCAQCGKSFEGKNKLYHHFRSVHFPKMVYSCVYCEQIYRCKMGLMNHIRTHTGEKPFTCEICKKSFPQKSGLAAHNKTHTGEKPFTCEVCKKSFAEKSNLMTHIKRHTGERPFTCEVCKKTFCWKRGLISHIKTHTGEKPFTCEVCKKLFTEKSNLMSHIKKHTGERPFTCKICKKSFCWKSGLRTHIKRHTGERPFTCEICKKSFTDKSNLTTHIKKHTGERPFTCEVCKKSFCYKSELMNHNKKTHR